MRVPNIRIVSLGVHGDSKREVPGVDRRRDAVVRQPGQLLGALRPGPAGLGGRGPRQSGLLGDHLEWQGGVSGALLKD